MKIKKLNYPDYRYPYFQLHQPFKQMILRMTHLSLKRRRQRIIQYSTKHHSFSTKPSSKTPQTATVRNLRCPTLRRVTRDYSRFYEVDGHRELFPSVTSVLNVLDKPGLKNWAVN